MSTGGTVVAIGDVQLGDSAICPGFGVGSGWAEGRGEKLFAGVASILRGDVVVANLETCLSHAGLDRDDWRSVQMRGPPEAAGALRAAGINVVNVANNHTFQHGALAFRQTLDGLADAGIDVCGLAGTDGWRCAPVRIDAAGTTVGVLGYSLRPRQFFSTRPPYAEGDEDAMLDDIRRLASEVQDVLVTLHWGEEFAVHPSAEEVRLARRLIDAGARIVAGHHPHVLRPIERYGRGVIGYSLGNFVSDMLWWKPLTIGAVLRCGLADPDDTDVVRIDIGDDFAPRPGTRGRPVSEPVVGLDPREYRRAIDRSQREQRLASYRFALRNLRRYPRRLLWQLTGATLGNKLRGLVGRA